MSLCTKPKPRNIVDAIGIFDKFIVLTETGNMNGGKEMRREFVTKGYFNQETNCVFRVQEFLPSKYLLEIKLAGHSFWTDTNIV